MHTTAFLSGFSLMGYEILGSRILSPYFGSSVYVWGGLIAVFMLGLSIGYFFGGRLADKHNSTIELSWIILCAAFFIFSASLLGKPLCSNISTLSVDVKYSALIASALLFTIPCICLGAISPYLVKLSMNKQNKIGTKVGNIYATSTIGSILGTFLVSFYLVGLISTSKGVQLLCLPLLTCSVLLFLSKNKFTNQLINQ